MFAQINQKISIKTIQHSLFKNPNLLIMKKFYFLLCCLFSLTTWAQDYDFTIYTPENSGIVSNRVDDIKIDSGGKLWLSTYYGVSTFNGTTWTNYTTSNSQIPTNAILKIEIDGQNRKWMATQMNGIVMFNGTTWTNYTTSNSGLPNNNINDIAVDSSNNVWIATDSGLTKFNGTSWTTYTSITNVNSVATSWNAVWVTSNGGFRRFNGTDFDIINDGAQKILKVDGDLIYVDHFDGIGVYNIEGIWMVSHYSSNSCLAGCVFESLDAFAGKVWVGFMQQCGDGGLQNFTDCTTYHMGNSQMPDNNIMAIKVQSANTIWVGTQEGGLVKMTLATPTGCFGKISAGNSTNTAIKNDGTLWCWGANINGSLGDGTANNSSVPKQISNTNDWKSIHAGGFYTMAIKNDGTLWGWGQNTGNMGDGGGSSQYMVPTQIGQDNTWQTLSCGGSHTLALRTNGRLWVWGQNNYGQLGMSNGQNNFFPDEIGPDTWISIAAGNQHSVGVKSDGTLWTWGYNDKGQLGDGTTTNRNAPVQIGTATNWRKVSASITNTFAIKADGTLWGWGDNQYGQLGDYSMEDRLTPVQVGQDVDWKSVDAAGAHTIAIKNNGSLWVWGLNNYGQLGSGNTTNQNHPVQVGTALDWNKAEGNVTSTIALKNDGTIWTWGRNFFGQLGNGNTTNRSTPAAINCPTSTLAVDGFEIANNMTVFPNPVNDILNIASDNEITAVSIYNMLGQQVITKAINANEGQIDVTGLNAGTYFVKVDSGDAVRTLKVIKK